MTTLVAMNVYISCTVVSIHLNLYIKIKHTDVIPVKNSSSYGMLRIRNSECMKFSDRNLSMRVRK